MLTNSRRLLTIGHSYVVALNRRLPHELATAADNRYCVTTVSPNFVHGDLRSIPLEQFPEELSRLVSVDAYITKRPHIMFYGKALRNLLAEKWDLIHCWEEPYIFAGAQLASWAKRQKLVFYTFQNIIKHYPPPFNWFEKFAMNRSSGWIAAGQTVESTLKDRARYIDKPRKVIALGVDVQAFCPNSASRDSVRSSFGWRENQPLVIGYLGRFTPEKGLAILMAALDTLQLSWRALFVGGGPLENDIRTWGSRFKDGRVQVVTGVPHDKVPAYLNAMDMLVAPSQTTPKWKEQLGRMLIEAMACGVPVVGSDSGEIPFVIGDAGVIVPEADLVAWATAISELIDNPKRRKELISAGLERVHSHFQWSVIARQHLEFFDEIIEKSN